MCCEDVGEDMEGGDLEGFMTFIETVEEKGEVFLGESLFKKAKAFS